MTIIVGNERVLMSDSRVTAGQNGPILQTGIQKIIRFKDSLVGFCGIGPCWESLTLLRKEYKNKRIKGTFEGIHDFCSRYREIFTGLDKGKDVEVELLILTTEGLWCHPAQGNFFPCSSPCAIGSGAPYALGVLYLDETALVDAVRAACHYLPGECGLPLLRCELE
jgi:ATP-dependent protease HslVU (ClpYQ) peptidase subunit